MGKKLKRLRRAMANKKVVSVPSPVPEPVVETVVEVAPQKVAKRVKTTKPQKRTPAPRVCSVCKETGHTKRSCPALEKSQEEEQPKKSWWRAKGED